MASAHCPRRRRCPSSWRRNGFQIATAMSPPRALPSPPREADLRTATQRPNPTLTLGASNVNPSAGIGAGPLRGKTFDSSARIDQLIERGSKAELRETQAQAALAAAKADVAEQLREQRLAMRTAYLRLGRGAGARATAARVPRSLGAIGRCVVAATESGRGLARRGQSLSPRRGARRQRCAPGAIGSRACRASISRSSWAWNRPHRTLDVRIEWPKGEESPTRKGDRPDVAAATSSRGCGTRGSRARAQHRHA